MEWTQSWMLLSLVGVLLSAPCALSFPGGWHVSRALEPNVDWDLTFPQDPLLPNNLYRIYVIVDRWANRDDLDAKLQTMFNNAAQYGAKLIVEFAYYDSQPAIETIKQDIIHFVPALQQNNALIAAVQAGWLGREGEWNGWPILPDGDDGSDPNVRDAKTFVVDAMKAVGVPVQVRYPIDKALYYNNDPQVNLHDNCLGSSETDTGTFYRGSSSGSPWPLWAVNSAKNYMKSLPWNGAESCSDTGGVVPDCPTLLQLVREYRIAYLNLDFPAQYRAYAQSVDDQACFRDIVQALHQNGGS